LNPELKDRVPVRLLRDESIETIGPEVLGAAGAFRAGGQHVSGHSREFQSCKLLHRGPVRTNFAEGVTDARMKAELIKSRDKFLMPPDAIARAVAFAIEQPADIDVSEMIVPPAAQG
jgi:hypothetical protein